MRTTIVVPDPLFRRVKAEAANRGMKLKDLINEALEKELAEKPPTPRHKVRLPLIRSKSKHKIHPARRELDESLWD